LTTGVLTRETERWVGELGEGQENINTRQGPKQELGYRSSDLVTSKTGRRMHYEKR
jgi:hypothetical protein